MNDPLHPNGRCKCCGEGLCDWCIDSCRRDPVPADVEVTVESDEAFARIESILCALGYSVERGPAKRPTLEESARALARRLSFTTREIEVVLAAVGLDAADDLGTRTAIARKLELSTSTVKWHLTNVYAKARVGSMVGLIKRIAGAAGARAPRRGTPAHPCEACSQTSSGSTNERGFQRCNSCGYPSQ